MTTERRIEEMNRIMLATGYQMSSSANFGLLFESRDAETSVEITRAGEWMLYRHEGMTGKQLAFGDCATKLFLAMAANGCKYDR